MQGTQHRQPAVLSVISALHCLAQQRTEFNSTGDTRDPMNVGLPLIILKSIMLQEIATNGNIHTVHCRFFGMPAQ